MPKPTSNSFPQNASDEVTPLIADAPLPSAETFARIAQERQRQIAQLNLTPEKEDSVSLTFYCNEVMNLMLRAQTQQHYAGKEAYIDLMLQAAAVIVTAIDVAGRR